MPLEHNLEVGLKGTAQVEVTPENTADSLADGIARVYATPNMIGLMEVASAMAVQPYLSEGLSTVGTLVNVTHIAATPIGFTARAEAELMAVEGRKLVFKVVAYDDTEKIGEGVHERFIIDMAKFMSRVQQKTARSE